MGKTEQTIDNDSMLTFPVFLWTNLRHFILDHLTQGTTYPAHQIIYHLPLKHLTTCQLHHLLAAMT
jgi:hypothetical protein